MSADIFRKVVLERLSTPEQLDQALVLTPAGSGAALWSAVVVVVVILAASVLVSIPIMATGVGIVLGAGGVSDVVAQHGGRVRRVLVRQGERVTPGQVVAELFQPDQENALATLRAELVDVQRQRDSIVALQERDASVQAGQRRQQRQELRQRAASLRQRVLWLEDRMRQEQALVDGKYLSRNKLQDTQTEHLQTLDRVAEVESQLKALDVADTAARHGRTREALDIELRIAAVQHRIGELGRKLQRESHAASTHAGVVAELKISDGDLVTPGQPLLALMPDDGGRPLAVLAYLPPAEGKKVQPGMAGRVSPKSVKKEEFGAIVSRVQSVSAIPATPEAMQRTLRNRQLVQTLSQNEAPIEVVMALEQDPARPGGLRWTSRGPDQPVDSGSTVEVEVIVQRKRLLVLVMPALERWLAVSPHSQGVWPFE